MLKQRAVVHLSVITILAVIGKMKIFATTQMLFSVAAFPVVFENATQFFAESTQLSQVTNGNVGYNHGMQNL